mgnify:CR=1 FL=1
MILLKINSFDYEKQRKEDQYRLAKQKEEEDLAKRRSTRDEGKRELLEAIKPALVSSISENFEVVNHESGLRPTSHDRRPYVGELENNPGIFILNGLGTRGVLVAPSMVKKLVDQIFN